MGGDDVQHGGWHAVIAPPPPRSPWQRLYTAAHRRRARRWQQRAERLPVPVWSVGNLHWGGTGKTPVVAALARWLRDEGIATALLSRGHGRQGREPLVVSLGDGPGAAPRESGDEPWLLADELPGVAVAVAQRRADAGRLLLAQLAQPPRLFLLDDGFSHLRLARDLDLLVLPADDPFGGGRLPPSGRLREPLAAARRAHALLLTGRDATPEAAREVATALSSYGFAGPGFAAPTFAQAPPGLPTGPLLLVTGIARPQRVRDSARTLGLDVAEHLVLADHHDYSERTLRRIASAAQRSGAVAVLTTTKDRVKLVGRLSLPLVELRIEARPEPAAREWLRARLPR